jgi:hypothetical protein
MQHIKRALYGKSSLARFQHHHVCIGSILWTATWQNLTELLTDARIFVRAFLLFHFRTQGV